MTASGNGHGQLCACSATASGTDRGCHHGCELRNCSSCFRARHSLSCSTRWLGSLSSCFGWASASSDVDQILLFTRAPLSEASERLCLTSCSPIQYSDTSSPTPAQLAQSIISKDPRPTLDYWYRTFSSVERDLSTSTIQPRTDNDVCMQCAWCTEVILEPTKFSKMNYAPDGDFQCAIRRVCWYEIQ